MEWNKDLIGENAGIVWRTLYNSKMSWGELLKNTSLKPLELASAIGWLAREDKIYIYPYNGILYFEIYQEHYY